MAVESKYLLHDLSRPAVAVTGDDEPTQDLAEQLSANDDPTEDVPVGEGGHESPAVAGSPGDDPFQPGTTLCGRYLLDRVVGRGGFSQVLRALDLDRQAAGDAEPWVAIKALRPEHRGSLAAARRLAGEYEVLRRLTHPGVVRVFGLAAEGDHVFEVMELLDGSSLATRLAQGDGPMSRDEARRVLRSCAAALDWVHQRGFVHGDVKPGNIFVTSAGDARLLDFGGTPSGPETGVAVGPDESLFATPAYASPQVLSGLPPGAADDLYSFACVAFQLLAGAHPFGRTNAREAQERGLQPVSPAALGDATAAALARGLAFQREDRPASASALLDGVFDARPVPRAEPSRAASSATRWRGPAALAALAALVIAVAWNAWPRDPARTNTAPVVIPAQPAATAHGADDPSSAPADGKRLGDTEAPPALTRLAPARTDRPAGQQVAFGNGSLVASRKAIAAAVPIRRRGEPEGILRVRWRIEEGSARAGQDFSGPLSGTVVLAVGQRASTLFVPLVPGAGSAGDAGFVVVLEGIDGPARAGDVTRVNVTLRDFRA